VHLVFRRTGEEEQMFLRTYLFTYIFTLGSLSFFVKSGIVRKRPERSDLGSPPAHFQLAATLFTLPPPTRRYSRANLIGNQVSLWKRLLRHNKTQP
jgi:hypothetical protein